MAPDFTLDFDRMRRVGFPDVVLAQGKTPLQVAEICRQLARAHDVLVTRLSPEQWEEVSAAPLPGISGGSPSAVTLAACSLVGVVMTMADPDVEGSKSLDVLDAGCGLGRVFRFGSRQLQEDGFETQADGSQLIGPRNSNPPRASKRGSPLIS